MAFKAEVWGKWAREWKWKRKVGVGMGSALFFPFRLTAFLLWHTA